MARAHGADVVSFPVNRGLKAGIAEGYRQALTRGYDYCGRLDADGQHLADELKRMLDLVRDGDADVAIGSRFLPESGKDGERYKPAPERVVGTTLLRLLMRLRLGQPISDGTSGLYAVDRSALELLADDYICEAPEVEALVRITDAKLKLVEVPGAHARPRARRVVVQGQARRRAGGHDRDGVVCGQAAARPSSASAGPGAGARAEAAAAAYAIAAEAVVSSTVPAS